MIGNIKTIEVKIDEDTTFQITSLFAKDSYGLYLKCASILSPLISGFLKNKGGSESLSNLNNEAIIEKSLSIITEKFPFEEVANLLKASNIKKNFKDFSDAEINVSSPILLIELFIHILKLNVVEELFNSKKDIGQIATRLFGSKIFQKSSETKAI